MYRRSIEVAELAVSIREVVPSASHGPSGLSPRAPRADPAAGARTSHDSQWLFLDRLLIADDSTASTAKKAAAYVDGPLSTGDRVWRARGCVGHPADVAFTFNPTTAVARSRPRN